MTPPPDIMLSGSCSKYNWFKTNYHLLQEEQLKELGIEDTDDEYVVDYVTGEVFNLTQKVTESGKSLYIYSKENT